MPKSASRNPLALLAICLASLMFGLEISSVPVILPALESRLQGDFKDLQWIMNAYTIACTVVLMATGALADRFGRKRVFLLSILAFGLASLLCGLADSTTFLIASRAIQGLAGGAMLITQVAILSQQFCEGRERSRAFAAWGMVFGIGLGFGPIIGGVILALSSWSWIFLVHGPLALLTLGLAISGVQESRQARAGKLDGAGIVLLSLAVFGLTFLLTQGSTLGRSSVMTILLATLVCFIAFIRVETRIPQPMFELRVFRNRRFSGALLGSVGMNFSFWPFMIYLPIYFHSVLGYSSLHSGLALLAYTLPTLVFPPLGERLALRFEPGRVIPLGLFCIGLGFVAMYAASQLGAGNGLVMLPGALLAGIGLGITNTPVTNTTTGSLPADRAGMASGIDMSARMISLALNIALMGLILVAGIGAYLRRSLSGVLDAGQLRNWAEQIAAGQGPAQGMQWLADGSVQAALAHGFGWVMLYGGLSVWGLALLSAMTFAPWRRPELSAPAPCSGRR
ncbi:Efflux pump transporter of major facilitator superfamily (MFS) [Pseudomonas chlororaphis subsp. aurantiaca]|uniref:MFS transporter n=1 Tax=Pseudomonas chlororaphis TaxID=587753 RepID=UPI000F580108|nr:MFS transporter [Pseudomonas chlororaphis]AZD54113.1 Efflux pump transporter of major facilitator superfamily (MFS) [Pseudomonas chlororaphis subsp. aurantiaca]